MRVTREKAAENRARIVATDSRLFREKGFDRVGLDAIMKEAGLSSRPKEFHLRALPDPYVNLSIHTAPDVRPFP